MSTVSPVAPPPLLVLRRALLWRLGLAATLVVMGWGYAQWQAWRSQLQDDLPATAALVAQLLNDDLALHASPFGRMVAKPSLEPLRHLAQRAPFCAEVDDLVSQRLTGGCLPDLGGAAGWTDSFSGWLAHVAGAGLSVTQTLVLPGGVKAGQITVQPHWGIEGRLLAHQGLILLAAGLTLMVTLVLSARLVARALAPANQVLIALRRLAQGELGVRLPPMALAELHHIGEGFNRLAETVSTVERRQQQLASHLLQAREDERRRLARDLHDEMGQSLSALQAEASAMQLMTRTLPQAHQSAQAMRATTAQLLDGLQRVLADLRPLALDEFGLPVALRTLTRSPQLRNDGGVLRVQLRMPDPWQALPPGHDIHVYRLVQEALTNVRRHSRASQVRVCLQQPAGWVQLEIEDNGCQAPSAALAPGHGLLGMRERVQALGGDAHWQDVPGGGLLLSARWPLDPAEARSAAGLAGWTPGAAA